MLKTVPLSRLSYSPWTTVNHSTYPLFKGEVRRGAPCVLTGQQPVGVSGAGRVGVGGGVGAGWTHGWRHVAVVVQHGAVTRVRRRGLRGGRVGPTQQRSGSPIHRLVRPDEQHRSEFTSTAYDQTRVCVCVCSVLYRPAAPPLSRSQRHPGPARTLLILLGLMEHSEGCVCQVLHLQTHRNLFISWQRTVVFMFAAFLQVSPGLFKPTACRLLKPFSSHYMLLWMQMQK